jgi:polyferredoxin
MDLQAQHGLMSTSREGWRNRGWQAWVIAALMIGFYCSLYWTEWLTPIAQKLHLGNKWYLYSIVYCLAMAGGAVYYLRRHGQSRYNQARVATNLTVQILLGFTLPFIMPKLGAPEFYFSYFWPLKYDYLFPQTLQSLPIYLAVYAVVMAFVVAPVLALFTGKRWYCSWVCGCGALANTYGDPWRHLSNKSHKAWKFEQYSIYATLIVAMVTTAIVWGGQLHDAGPKWHAIYDWTKWGYGFLVGSILAGVIGTGLYPLLGTRIWCRNFCPLAALLGLSQKAGAFRIRVKPDMCISCGNCSAYCEMGIDVRAYAQSNTTFTRASCVGCGMCAHVCPRGVLKLESTWSRSKATGYQGVSIPEV